MVKNRGEGNWGDEGEKGVTKVFLFRWALGKFLYSTRSCQQQQILSNFPLPRIALDLLIIEFMLEHAALLKVSAYEYINVPFKL